MLRFWLLCTSIRGCPFDTVTGLLLNMLRRDLLQTLPRPPFDDATALTILYELLADVKDFSVHAIVGRHELHMGILTFYRALLLKEKVLTQLAERGLRMPGSCALWPVVCRLCYSNVARLRLAAGSRLSCSACAKATLCHLPMLCMACGVRQLRLCPVQLLLTAQQVMAVTSRQSCC